VVELLLNLKIFDKETLQLALPFASRDVETVANLPVSMLDPNARMASIAPFQPRIRQTPGAAEGQVVPFKPK
jgi:hypothetical protein